MINKLKKGETILFHAVLIEKKNELVTKNGKPYLNLTVRDKTGSVNGKLWGYKPETEFWIKEGVVASIDADVDEYNGAIQLNIKRIEENNKIQADEFAKKTRFDVEVMWKELVDLVGTFEEPLTRFVAEEILLKHDKVIEAFKKAPAAKVVHNAWYGGLLEHINSLCKVAEPTIAHYKSKYYPKLSRDKVLFGLMLHDSGKILEYDYSKPSFDLSGLGIFTNHIVIVPAWIFEAANRFDATKDDKFKLERAHLMHLVAAHHGKEEWGSPVKPASLEALLVHHLDNLDSKIMHALELIETKPGPISGFTEKSYFEGVPFYIG